MKYIFFKEVSIRNFLSVGNDPVVVNFKPGLHVITGNNKDKTDRANGVGKSTILDGLYFGIFGETIREIPNDKIINNVTKKGSIIELDFDIKESDKIIQYKVIRTLSPSKCFLYENSVDITQSSIAKTTEKIKEIIGTTPEVFRNAVLMTVNESTPFMAQKGVLKRKFIEGIMNLSVFGQMLNDVRNIHNEYKKEYEIEAGKIPTLKNTIEVLEAELKDREIKKEEKIKELEKNKSDISVKIKDIEKNIQIPDPNELELLKKIAQEITKKIKLYEDDIESLTVKLTETVTEYKTYVTKLNNLSNLNITTLCDTCNRPFSQHDEEQIKKHKIELQESIEITHASATGYKEKIISTKNDKASEECIRERNILEISKWHGGESKYNNDQHSIQVLENFRNKIDSEIQSIKISEENKNTETILRNSRELYGEISTILDSIKNKIGIIENVKFVVSEEGVKTHITKKILRLLNSKINYYLQKMDANCTVEFDQYFEEKITNELGDECSYFNFSGAERKNIDLSCLFAFMDIRRLQGDVYINISAYDELLDSSLDAKGLELVLDILKERVEKYQEGCYIVSHRKEAAKQATGEVVFLEKHNRITRRVPYNA